MVLDREGRRVAATPEWASLDGLAWAPDGREVWLTASEVGADNSLRALSLDGRVRTVLSGMGRLVLHDVAPDGRVLLERATLRSEVLFRRAGDAEDRDLSWLDFSAVEGISADGNTVLFYESGQGGGTGLHDVPAQHGRLAARARRLRPRARPLARREAGCCP